MIRDRGFTKNRRRRGFAAILNECPTGHLPGHAIPFGGDNLFVCRLSARDLLPRLVALDPVGAYEDRFLRERVREHGGHLAEEIVTRADCDA